jgi:transcriptional regulator, XRE family
MHSPVVSVPPDESVHETTRLMDEQGFSQLPVVRDGTPRGLVTNSAIRERSDTDESVGELPAAEVMHEAITTVEPDTHIEAVDAALDHNDAVLVVEGGETTGIITEADIARQIS